MGRRTAQTGIRRPSCGFPHSLARRRLPRKKKALSEMDGWEVFLFFFLLLRLRLMPFSPPLPMPSFGIFVTAGEHVLFPKHIMHKFEHTLPSMHCITYMATHT